MVSPRPVDVNAMRFRARRAGRSSNPAVNSDSLMAALRPGDRLGPYEIISPLGVGGMGEVYRARDSRLGRDVAVKVMAPAFAADPDRLRRFEQEARAIAALNHPHICQIYDVGPGYLVLEFLEGTPLSGPMPIATGVRLAVQIASALEAAHRRGILHRDLKPANILVVSEDTAKLLDFGLAKTTDGDAAGTRTMDGAVIGTAAYMSPEQAEGKPLDVRSDVFSFGSVLYEMFSGTRAFSGNTMAHLLSAVLRDEPPPLQASPALDRIVRRCVAKSPAERFQTMTEVRDALELIMRGPVATPALPSIAVLPFVNMSADQENEYFSDGLAEEIINALAHIPGLKVIARTSAFAFKGKNEDIRRIAETLGVAHILEGSVRKAANRIRVTAQLIAAADGSHLWSERYDRELADVFAIQDEIAQAIAAALLVRLTTKPAALRRHSPKLPAYEAFLRGRHHLFKFTPESWTRGTESFQQAISLDPEWAQPHAELGLAYLMSATNGHRPLRDVVHLIRDEAQRALALDPLEPAPQFLLGSVAAIHDYDWREAEERFRAAMASSSAQPDMHWAYASFYLQAWGRFEEAVAEMEREVERDPLNVAYLAILSSHLNHAERYDQALENSEKAIAIDEGNWVPHFIMAETYAYTGRFAEAIAEGETAHRVAPWNSMPTGVLAGALACVGEKSRARELVREMGETPLPLWGRVEYHLLCSEIDEAADWYEQMIEQRDPFAIVFAHAPVGRALRQNARWSKLAGMMNLSAVPDGPT
jgi:serine/threonine-protein kinase